MLCGTVEGKLTWDESDGDTNDQVDGQEDQLTYPSVKTVKSNHGKTLTLLVGR